MNQMKYLLILATGAILSAGCSSTPRSNWKPAQLDSLFATVPDFSGTVMVEQKGKVQYAKAFGYRDYNSMTPNDTSTIFELASVSKQFTAMIIMMLQEEGKIRYEDPVTKYYVDFPYKGITIRHLLTHTSGLPDYQKVMSEHWDKSLVAGNPDILNYLKLYRPPIRFQPGEKYEYSNTGYVVLASIAELASGQDFVQLCRDKIFKPLKMTATDIRTNEDKSRLPNLAVGHKFIEERGTYVRADSFPESNYIFWLGYRKGPGRVSSTINDLVKWDQALAEEKLVSEKTLELAYTPAELNDHSKVGYGYGWEIRQDQRSGRVVWHTGSNPGYNTVIIRYLDVPVTIIVLSNQEHPRGDKSFDPYFRSITDAIESIVTK